MLELLAGGGVSTILSPFRFASFPSTIVKFQQLKSWCNAYGRRSRGQQLQAKPSNELMVVGLCSCHGLSVLSMCR